MIKETKYFSWRKGPLPKGCELCVRGLKSVFFVTGLCSKDCFFCPISDYKKNQDVIFINEWETSSPKEILKEIKLCSSKGVGITGGDPMLELNRTLSYIRMLKKKIPGFHIHMYVPLEHVDRSSLKKLFKAGVDEIRFHPDLEDTKYWERISLASDLPWDVGVEIPVIPKKEDITRTLLDFLNNRVKFLNLNELEMSDSNFSGILKRGYKTKDTISYGVQGSEELAFVLLDEIDKKYKYRAHYCTCKLKDRVQLANRIKNRSKNAAKPYDIVQKDGILVRGAIYPELFPGYGYREQLAAISKTEHKKILESLNRIRRTIMNEFEIPREFIEVDKLKLRILTNATFILEVHEDIPYKCAIVKEYPTHDQFEVEIEVLKE